MMAFSEQKEGELDEVLLQTLAASDPPSNTVVTEVGHSATATPGLGNLN